MRTLDESIFDTISTPEERIITMNDDNVLKPTSDNATSFVEPMMAARWKTLEKRMNQIKAAFEKKDEEVADFLKMNMDRTPRTGTADKTAYKKMHLSESLFLDTDEEAEEDVEMESLSLGAVGAAAAAVHNTVQASADAARALTDDLDNDACPECEKNECECMNSEENIIQEEAELDEAHQAGLEYDISPVCYRIFVEAPNTKDPEGYPILLLSKPVKKPTGIDREIERFNNLKDTTYASATAMYIYKYPTKEDARADSDGMTVMNDGVVYNTEKNADGEWEVVLDNRNDEYPLEYQDNLAHRLLADLGSYGANDKYSKLMQRLRRLGNEEMKGRRFRGSTETSEGEVYINDDKTKIMLNSKNLVKFDWAKKVANEYRLLFSWLNPSNRFPAEAPLPDSNGRYWAYIDMTHPVEYVEPQHQEEPVPEEPAQDALSVDETPIEPAVEEPTNESLQLSEADQIQKCENQKALVINELIKVFDSQQARAAKSMDKGFAKLMDTLESIVNSVTGNADKLGDLAEKITPIIKTVIGVKK